MQVSRWGNSLAVRLPAALVAELGLREGDHLDVRVLDHRTLEVARNREREEAAARLGALAVPLPADYKFDREEIHDRSRRDE